MGKLNRRWIAGLAILAAGGVALVAAAMGQPPASDPIGDLIARSSGAGTEAQSSFERRFLTPLLRASCPPGAQRHEAEAIGLDVGAVSLQGINPFRKTIGQLTFVGGFHLTSPDKRFGGLSGLDLRPDGGLLAISDTGNFVWIDVAADGFTPVAARLAPILDEKGEAPRNKVSADAEGLAVIGDVALVSFEQEHRVLAYDLGACGAAARGAPIVFDGFSGPFPKAFDQAGLKVTANQGAEGLAVTPGWMMAVGVETKSGETSLVSARAIESAPQFDLAVGADLPELVGLDILPADGNDRELRLFSLHRSSNPLASTVIAIVETRLEASQDLAGVESDMATRAQQRFRVKSSRVLAEMNVFVTIDNFEGLAARRLPDGRVRLFVISDDNFSDRQRTLLMVYDLPA